MAEQDDDSPSFDLEQDEVKSIEAQAKRAVIFGTDYDHLRGQLAALEQEKEPVMIVHAQAAWELCWHWRQLGEMVASLAKLNRGEHGLLKEMQRLKDEHAEDLDQITGKVLQCEKEIRELRQWKDRAIQQYQIPDTDE